MSENPYSRMAAAIRGNQDSSAVVGTGAARAWMRLGTVTQRAPLRVTTAGVSLPTSALRINERLTMGATWTEFDGLATLPVRQTEIDLDVGDQVLMLTEDDQIFYIMMRVVRAV